MHDSVYLVRHPQGRKTPRFLTWGSNDPMVNPARYPELLAALEAHQHPYMAEWQPSEHAYFTIAGAPYLQQLMNVAPTIVPSTGSNPTDPSGFRANLFYQPPP